MTARISQLVIVLLLLLSTNATALVQQEPNGASHDTTVPRAIAFNGTLTDHNGQPLRGVTGVTFALYSEQHGGAPVWVESQNVQADEYGRYSILLGAASGDGLPLELFTSAQPRWLGVQAQIPGEEEEARVLLVSVPYALKAGDADTIGGKPASAFVLAQPKDVNQPSEDGQASSTSPIVLTPKVTVLAASGTGTTSKLPKWLETGGAGTLGDSVVTESGGKIGLNNATPDVALDASGTIRAVLGPGAPFGTYLIPTGGAANGFRFGFGNNLYFDGTNWRTKGDGANNAGSGLLTDIGTGAMSIYAMPSTGATDQVIANSSLPNFEKMRVRGDGRVGIGTASPGTMLDVSGTIRAVLGPGAPFGTYLMPTGGAANGFRFGFGNNLFFDGTNWRTKGDGANNSGSGILTDIGSGQLSIFTLPSTGATDQVLSDSQFNAFEKVRISSSGNMGIGTTNPTAKLDVNGTVKATGYVGDGSGLTNVGAVADNSVTSAKIADGTIVNADISGAAAIDPTKIAGTAAVLNAANSLTAPLGISTASGVVIPGGGGLVAAVASEYTGSPFGAAILGAGTDPTGENVGVIGFSYSSSGYGGIFGNDSFEGVSLLAVDGNDDDVFAVMGNGNVGVGATDGLSRLTVRGAAAHFLTGTVSVTASSNVVTGTGTKFGSEVGIGDRITSTFGEVRSVSAITSDTSLTTSTNWNSTASGGFTLTPSVFRIDDSNGNVRMMMDGANQLGIGTLTPTSSLDVNGRSVLRNRVTVSGNNQRPSMLTVRPPSFAAIGGTVSVTSGSTSVTGTATLFTTNIGLGDRIALGAPSSEIRTVVAIADNSHLTVDSNFTVSAGSVSLTPIAGLFRADDTAGNPQFLISDSGNVAIGGSLVPTDRLQVSGDIRVGTSGTNGCIKAFGGSVIGGTCSSDARLKTDVQPFSPVLDRVMQLQPVSYNWKADEHPEYHFGSSRTSGLIAQEVEKAFPDMVATDERGYKAVNYSQLPLLLLQAMKDLKEESDRRDEELTKTVNQQQAQIQELLSAVEKLQQRLDTMPTAK